MRILFVLPYVPSLIRVRPYNFIRQLARQHEVSVLAIDSSRGLAETASLRSSCRSIDVVPMQFAASLLSCVRAAACGDPLQAAVCRSPHLGRQLRVLLDREGFDVVHVEHLRAAHARSLIPDTFPTVFDSVDCISLLLQRTLCSSHSLLHRVIAVLELHRTRAYEARLMREYDRIAVTSPEDLLALQALAPRSGISVVPNGVDLEYFHPLDGPREQMTIVLSGKMSYHANVTATLHFVHHIFPRVRTVHPEAHLRIVGASPPKVLRDLARDPAITVTGYLPDIRVAIGRATIAVCPVTVKVGIQNKLLEAMAMGLPVVSTKHGAEGLAVVPGRDLLVAASEQEFAEHICRLLDDPLLRGQFGRTGRCYVEKYHRWEDASQRLEALYEEAIAARNAGLPRYIEAGQCS